MFGAVENKAGGLVDGQRPRARGGIGYLPGVDGQGLGFEDVDALCPPGSRSMHLA